MRSCTAPRMKLLRLALTAAFAVIVARAFGLAIRPDPRLVRQAGRQYSGSIEIAPRRGAVYDRKGNVLARSVEVTSIYAEPRRLADLPPARRTSIVAALSRALDMSPSAVTERLGPTKSFVWLKRRVPPEMARAVGELKIDGVGAVPESKRFYPNVELAGHVLGFAGLDSEGLEGIERRYDDLLKWKAQRLSRARDARGRLYADQVSEETEVGRELVMTLDQQIQFFAENALRKGVQNSRASGGFVIVEDPRTGEILAMAGYPHYNPNAYWKAKPDDWRNRAVTDVFEPGSTLKPVLIAAALEAGVIRSDDSFHCENGSIDVADLTIHDTKKHGWLDVAGILRLSSNIGMIKIGRLLGKDAYYEALQRFGFGEKSGIDLPGDSGGLVPPKNRWTTVTLASTSFGHNIGVTGIQLVSAISALANGGVRMRPYLVQKVVEADGTVVDVVEPAEVGRVVPEEVARAVGAMMETVVGPEGSGSLAALDDYRVAGKTGTAQKVDNVSGGYSDERIASFVGFVPASRPRLTILVVLDEPKTSVYGGVVAAPVFREVARDALRYLGVPPDRESPRPALAARAATQTPEAAAEGYVSQRLPEADGGSGAVPEPGAAALSGWERVAAATRAAAETPAGIVPDFRGLSVRSALRLAEPRRLEIEVTGSGRATRQEPAAGSKALPGEKVRVWFEAPLVASGERA